MRKFNDAGECIGYYCYYDLTKKLNKQRIIAKASADSDDILGTYVKINPLLVIRSCTTLVVNKIHPKLKKVNGLPPVLVLFCLFLFSIAYTLYFLDEIQ